MYNELMQILWYTMAASGVVFWFYLGYVFYVAVTTSSEIGNSIIDPYDSLMDGGDYIEEKHNLLIDKKESQHA